MPGTATHPARAVAPEGMGQHGSARVATDAEGPSTVVDGPSAMERMTRLELATLTLARLCATNCATSAFSSSLTAEQPREGLFVRDTGIEPVTSSVSGKRSPAELNARALHPRGTRWVPSGGVERMTRLELATLTLARLCATNCATSAFSSSLTAEQPREGLFVRDTGIEPVTSSVSGKRSPAELNARGARWKRESNPCTRFCRPLPKPLSHSTVASPPRAGSRPYRSGTGRGNENLSG